MSGVDRLPACRSSRLGDGSSALCKALHKADYAKSMIMESISTESTPTADWQRLMGIPAFT